MYHILSSTMFPRCYILAKHVCQKAAVPSCERNYSITINVAVRQFYVLHRNTYLLTTKPIKARNFAWTPSLYKKESGKGQADETKTNDVVSSQKPVPEYEDPKQSTPVLKIIAPAIKSDESNPKTDKVNLDNVQEQSLENVGKPKPVIKKITEKIINIRTDAKTDAAKTVPKKRSRVDLTKQSLERNFITPVRAMSDFLLRPSDLESLPKTMRRSPYENELPITVYWRKDVEAKALCIWGSKENLQKELLKRDIEKKKYQQNIFTMKRRLRDYRRELGRSNDEEVEGIMGRSGKVILTAIAINGVNCLFKLVAWLYTGSHSMFSECIHSLADTVNQLILAYGIHKSVQVPDSYHPYGYTNMKYVASLISGVGIFCVGTGLSIYHGISGLLHPEPMSDFFWAYFVLGGSLVSEGATWLVAYNSIRKGARNINMPIKDYILRSQDPSVNVVLLEDFAAVVSVIVAGGCMSLSTLTNSSVPDSIGSLLVGGILGSVASFIIYTNTAALVGRSIPEDNIEKINGELESDVMVRAIHDVKGIDMGNYLVRYKAELDFDGRELTRSYLDKQDLNELLEEARNLKNIDEFEEFMLKHGENIVDMMGGEIDRIEMKLRKKHPEIRHCDLEIL